MNSVPNKHLSIYRDQIICLTNATYINLQNSGSCSCIGNFLWLNLGIDNHIVKWRLDAWDIQELPLLTASS